MVTLGAAVLYRLVYTTDGLLDGAVRFTDLETVAVWREFIQRLYGGGKDLASFFERSVAGLKPRYIQRAAARRRCRHTSGESTRSEISGSASHAVQVRDVHRECTSVGAAAERV